MRRRFALGVTFLSPLLLVAQPSVSHACGGCFHPPTATSTVVTAHRMAFATSPTRTVLWDQIQYSGDPSEFSWVLPVKGNVRLEAANDAWFEALEAVTNTRVSPPRLNCVSFSDGGGSGCACGAASSDSATSFAGSARGPGELDNVVVSHQGSVGPYEYVQIMGGGEALSQWLPRNGYAVPSDLEPMLTAYADEGFGFIALKLKPGAQTKQMTPVRVITDGGMNTLPLRMVAAGTGPFVGITLYLIAEGRYQVDGFGDAKVDTSGLTWDWNTSQSNYSIVREAALKAEGGKIWLTSFAFQKGFTRTFQDALGQPIVFAVGKGTGSSGQFGTTFTNLTDLYFAQAAADANRLDSCSSKTISSKLDTSLVAYEDCKSAAPPADGGVPSFDGGASSGKQCGATPSGAFAASSLECDGFSDVAAAMIGMHPDTVWLTRLEANLPRESLANDLKIKPAALQETAPNTVRASVHVNPPCDLLENHPEVQAMLHRPSEQAGIGLVSGLGLFFARRLRRRRERPVT